MKIFSMNDCDWMAGETLETCMEEYLKKFCVGMEENDNFEDPHELNESEYDKLLFHDDDGKVRSYREQLQLMVERGDKFPVFFASTE